MNEYDHQRVEIEGVPIHFMRVPGKGPNPTPIILTHGWPWTFWDYRHMVDALADPLAHGGREDESFDVIVPSLPGYGFSVPLRTTGVDVARVADLWVTLMRDVLGYDRFAAAGGDWGGFITGHLGHAHAEHMIGVYLTFPVIPGLFGRNAPKPEQFAEDEHWMLDRMRVALRQTESHMTVHRRDARTLAYAMADSPAGLAAWLCWRRQLWCHGDAVDVFGYEDLCTLASLYWFDTSFASAIRIYAEQFTKPAVLAHDRVPVIEAPTGFAVFPEELIFTPRAIAETHTDLRRWTVFERGGHFAPAEQPEPLIKELRTFFSTLR
ncbi:MAG: epoxide hydrolase [Gammaproteobacteria bacterium]|nr:epoxide hydrolase [Gammaproteobacteria bacterium]